MNHSPEHWHQLAQAALKGKDPASLHWSDSSGVKRPPIYFDRPTDSPSLEGSGAWQTRAIVSLGQVEDALAYGAEELSLTETGYDKPHYLEAHDAPVEGSVLGVALDPFLWQDLERAQSWVAHGAKVTLDGYLMREAGASPLQELAWLAAEAVEASRTLTLEALEIRTGCSTDFFTEMAKVRALRQLLARVAQETGQPQPRICARNLLLQATSEDPYPNLLRAVSAGMSAVLGGCDSLTLQPYNLNDPNSVRLALNQQNLMRHESFLDRTSDPAAGAYAVEHLTQSLAGEAWKTMQNIEKEGGFQSWYSQGGAKQSLVPAQRPTIGGDRFPTPEPVTSKLPSLQLPEALGSGFTRLAEPFEALRRQPGPTLQLYRLSDHPLARAREQFARDFLEPLGFQFADHCEAVVLCGQNEDLATAVGQLEGRFLIAAAPPQEVDGISCYLHRGADPLTVAGLIRKGLQARA